jgi:hypothetical protein
MLPMFRSPRRTPWAYCLALRRQVSGGSDAGTTRLCLVIERGKQGWVEQLGGTMRIERGKQRWVERLRGTMRRERGQGLVGEDEGLACGTIPAKQGIQYFFCSFFFFCFFDLI